MKLILIIKTVSGEAEITKELADTANVGMEATKLLRDWEQAFAIAAPAAPAKPPVQPERQVNEEPPQGAGEYRPWPQGDYKAFKLKSDSNCCDCHRPMPLSWSAYYVPGARNSMICTNCYKRYFG